MMRLLILSCFALGCLVACDDSERRRVELESKYHALANRCLAVGMRLGDASQCLLADTTAQDFTYSDMIVECTGGGWFQGPQICGTINIYYEWREGPGNSVITGWRVGTEERRLQKGFAR
jgi:hypothetical protein